MNKDIISGSGWFSMPNWVWEEESNLSEHERSVVSNIMRRLGNDGKCFPSRNRIAKDIGISIKTVQRALNALSSKKIIEVKRRKNKSSLYSLGKSLQSVEFNRKGLSDLSKSQEGTVSPTGRDCESHISTTHLRNKKKQQQQTQNVVVALMKYKIQKKAAAQLAEDYSEDLINIQIQNLEKKIKSGSEIGNAAGWLVSAIMQNYEPVQIAPKDIREQKKPRYFKTLSCLCGFSEVKECTEKEAGKNIKTNSCKKCKSKRKENEK